MGQELYTTGEYLKNYPNWHVEDSPMKAQKILKLMKNNKLAPKTICEIGCGAGEILRQLQLTMPDDCHFYGYEISPQAFELCKTKANERLNFILKDFLIEKTAFFDVILLIDLIEHIEDYFTFLREIKNKSEYKIFHIPLDICVQLVLRNSSFTARRLKNGHIHYFTKDFAIIMLKDLGFEIIDNFYTPGGVELSCKSLLAKLAKFPRKILFSIHQDIAARILGGFGLMVLAK